LVDLRTGEYTDAMTVEEYDQIRVARDRATSTGLNRREDIAGIQRREDYAVVYLVEDLDGQLEAIVLPVRGYGLWSTMWGFLALEADASTVRGLSFFEHGETPGLGGEIDNPRWQARWEGKQIYDDAGEVAIQVIKGSVDPDEPGAQHRVDGLSGATLTARGVHNMMQFWLGERGFKPYLISRKEEA
jgi:Na+-transporting NADH:ubiquinone oxidoreductase subunit C